MVVLRNALVVAVITLMLFLGAWQYDVPRYMAAEWFVIVVATSVLTLWFNDLFDKLFNKEKRDLVNIWYIGGLVIALVAVASWIWLACSNTTSEFIWRLVATFLLSGADILFMGTLYKKSITSEEDLADEKIERFRAREQKRWERWRRKIEKASKEDAIRYLASHLRFALVGDSYSGDLDFARPLAVVGDETLTYDELVKRDVSDSLSTQVMMYINSLV